MNWHSWSDFLSMGGYGLYVWGSYAAVGALTVCETAVLRVRLRRAFAQLRRAASGQRQKRDR
jgi:heme exporter protein D